MLAEGWGWLWQFLNKICWINWLFPEVIRPTLLGGVGGLIVNVAHYVDLANKE